MSFGMGGERVVSPERGRWGNTFRLEATVEGRGPGRMQFKAYFVGVGVADGVRLIDWHDADRISLVQMTKNLHERRGSHPEYLGWYVGVRWIGEDGETRMDERMGEVRMARFGDHYRVAGS